MGVITLGAGRHTFAVINGVDLDVWLVMEVRHAFNCQAHIHLGEVAVALHAAQAAPPGCAYAVGRVIVVVIVVPVANRIRQGQNGVAEGMSMSNRQRKRIKLRQQKAMQSVAATCGGQKQQWSFLLEEEVARHTVRLQPHRHSVDFLVLSGGKKLFKSSTMVITRSSAFWWRRRAGAALAKICISAQVPAAPSAVPSQIFTSGCTACCQGITWCSITASRWPCNSTDAPRRAWSLKNFKICKIRLVILFDLPF